MTCSRFAESAFAYFEGQLRPAERAELEAHLAGCEECRELRQHAAELTCREFADFLADYCDGELPAEQARVFDRHIAICPPCGKYLDSYKDTSLLASLCKHDQDGIPPDVPEELVRAILAARQAQARGDGGSPAEPPPELA